MKSDLRVTLTKRMLKDALVRCLTEKPLSRITVSELCREAGVNRATFYNHYQSPAMVLKDITHDYARNLKDIYESCLLTDESTRMQAIEACLAYLDEKRADVLILFSENAENNVVRFEEEIVDDIVENKRELMYQELEGDDDSRLVYAIITASASYGLIRAWIKGHIDKTPAELAALLSDVFGDGVL